MRYVLTLLLVVCALASRAAPLRAQTQDGSISGRVLNGSDQNRPISGANVSLYALDGPNKRLVASAQTDVGGLFRFDGVPQIGAVRYVAAASNDGVSYNSALIQTAASATAVDITVFRSANDPSVLHAQRLSMVPASVDAKAGLITFVENYRVENSSTETFAGTQTAGQAQTIRFSLFPGARSLTPFEGFGLDDATATSEGFAISAPLQPGVSVISFSYEVPFRKQSLDLRRDLNFPLATVELVLPGNLRISSPQLTDHRSLRLGDRSFDTLQANDLQAGAPLELRIAGLPSQPRPLVDLSSLTVQISILALIVTGIACFVFVSRARLPNPVI
jgi:hypothetical protein